MNLYQMSGHNSSQSVPKDQIQTYSNRISQQKALDQVKQSTNLQEKSSIHSEMTKYDKAASNNPYVAQEILSNNNQSEQLILQHNQRRESRIRKSQKWQVQINCKQKLPQLVTGIKTKNTLELKSKILLPQNLINRFKKKSQSTMINQVDNSTLKLVHINGIIIDRIETSQVLQSKLAHVIIPFGLALLEIYSLTKRSSTYVHKKFLQILKLLNNRDIQNQIDFKLFQSIHLFFAQYRYKTQEEITQMLLQFLTAQRRIMEAVCPYYLNMFMMIVNKNIIFNGHNARFHMNYTINFAHTHYDQNFTVQNVLREVKKLEIALADAYNSNQI